MVIMKMIALRWLRRLAHQESGIAFMETAIALAILGVVSVSFLSGLTTASRTVIITDEHATAESLAQSQMEWVKNADYSYGATSYAAAPLPGGKDYQQYSATVLASPLHTPDDGLQKITITILRSGKEIFILEGYKVNR